MYYISAIRLELPNRLRAAEILLYISFIAGVLKPCLDILKFYLTIDIDWISFCFGFFFAFFWWLFIVIAGDISSNLFFHVVVAVVILFFLLLGISTTTTTGYIIFSNNNKSNMYMMHYLMAAWESEANERERAGATLQPLLSQMRNIEYVFK